MKVRKYIQARTVLVAIPAALALTAVAFGQASTKHDHSHVITTTQVETSGTAKPRVSVNGRHVDVPIGKPTTVNQGDSETTISVTPASAGQAGGSSATTTSSNESVSVSVTSNGDSGNQRHSTTYVHSDGGTSSHSHQSVTLQKSGTGAVQVSQ